MTINNFKNTFRRVALLAMLPALIPVSSSARELVITMKSGKRVAYHLSEDNKETAKLTLGDQTIIINGDSYNRADFKELRIYKELPEGVDIADAIQGIGVEPDTAGDDAIYDLSGRRIASDSNAYPQLHKGIYIINRKKIIKP